MCARPLKLGPSRSVDEMWIKTRVAIKRARQTIRAATVAGDEGFVYRSRGRGNVKVRICRPAVVCFSRIPLHSWVYCLLTEATEPVARESMSIADDGKELGQTGGTTAVVTVATVSWPSRLTPVSGPIGTGAMGSFQKLIHLHALPWPRGIVNHNGDNVMAKGLPSPSPPSPPIPMLDRSADGMHPARGGGLLRPRERKPA